MDAKTTMECLLCGECAECEICAECEEFISHSITHCIEEISNKDLLEAYSF